MAYQTREDWLNHGVQLLGEYMEGWGYTLPKKIQVACGWPKGGKTGCKIIGQCFSPSVTKDDTTHLFICPTLGEDQVRVLDVLLHECIHASIGVAAGHGAKFRKAMQCLGLTGKATATVCPVGSPLHQRLLLISGTLGPYPHSSIIGSGDGGEDDKPKRLPQGGWIRFKSPTLGDDYKLRVSPVSFRLYGAPLDPLGDKMIRCHSNGQPVEDDGESHGSDAS